jgi:hypothetical protein
MDKCLRTNLNQFAVSGYVANVVDVNTCGVARVYEAMTEEDVKALRALLAAPIPAIAVARELEAANFKISYQMVYRHRSNTCSCGSL